ncbi:MAG: TetR/AcrR family transcriptional regulator [Stackebrandtia sp.]
MSRVSATNKSPGRPRSSVDETVFAATLSTVHELGYARATVDRIAATAGIAKTTIYRRWPSKGTLITACLIDAFGALPPTGPEREENLSILIRWVAAKTGEPGLGAAFAGVFTDAVNDPLLRGILSSQLQAPFVPLLMDLLGESEQRVLFIIDVVVGTLLHRMGMTGEPMVESDVDTLVEAMLSVIR